MCSIYWATKEATFGGTAVTERLGRPVVVHSAPTPEPARVGRTGRFANAVRDTVAVRGGNGMDSTLMAAVISAVVGVLAAAGGAVLRNRATARTAARLIYAELTKNSAAVMYFRQTSSWAAPVLLRSAWDEHGATIARQRRGRFFEAVHRGYEALEIVPLLADESVDDEVRAGLLLGSVDSLVEAIKELGAVAQISPDGIKATVDRLLEPPTSAVRDLRARFGSGAGITSLALQGQLVAAGLSPRRAGQLPELVPLLLPSALVATQAQDAGCIVYSARHQEELGRREPARWSGEPPTGDSAVDETLETLEKLGNFGRQVLGRDPLAEKPLIAVVHYGNGFNNAWWDGEQLIMGDGDGAIFGRFSQCPEVIAGEVWHGVPEMLRYFDWDGENGALNLSLCDVFGQLFKQYTLDQTVEQADWVVGAGLLAPGIHGTGLRSLKAPGTAYNDDVLGIDPQPAHMNEYVQTTQDRGGVHINGGIPNHAFYLVAHHLGGKAWETAGQIWWDALTGSGARQGMLFADWAGLTAEAASARHGTDSSEYRAVIDAWDRVGVTGAN
jgi:hypothetical protein